MATTVGKQEQQQNGAGMFSGGVDNEAEEERETEPRKDGGGVIRHRGSGGYPAPEGANGQQPIIFYQNQQERRME